MTNLPEASIKRKNRWTMQGLNNADTVVFPETFIKMVTRPNFPYEAVADENGGRIQHVPGKITCIQDLMPENQMLTHLEFDVKAKWVKNVSKVHLRCYDGVGEVIEHWTLDDAKLTVNSLWNDPDPSSDEIEIEWLVSYQKSEYVSKKPIKTKIPSNSKVILVIHEDGQATLTIDGWDTLVGRSSGLDEAIKLFNKTMKTRHLSYRLASGFPEVFREILGLNSIETSLKEPTEEQLVAIEAKIQEIRSKRMTSDKEQI